MASKMLGRAACPECGFAHAHVKISDKENAKAYRYCPECSSQYYARSQAQHDSLVSKMCHPPAVTPEAPTAALVLTPDPSKPPAAEKAVAAPETASYKVILGVRVPA
jgi:ssDNA-binding Zn-finger/Zn-ribbon topoisomerase 1